MNNSQAHISIITVVFNAEAVLERTIKSVINQTSKDFEYILIDGKSTDNTISIINNYREHFTHIISEPDKGLYDAMNKGIDLAKGQFLWFLNAGDEIAENSVIEKLIPYLNSNDIVYSDTFVIDEHAEVIGLLSQLTHNNAPEKLSWRHMNRGMVVCHQSFLVKKTNAPYFNLKYSLSADIDWIILCLKNSEKVIRTDFCISKFMRAGLSKQKLNKAMKERYHILKSHFGYFPNLYNHIYLLYRFISKGRKSKVN